MQALPEPPLALSRQLGLPHTREGGYALPGVRLG